MKEPFVPFDMKRSARDPGRALLQNLLSSKDGTAMAAKVIEVLGI